jgi:hypothetical protein
MERYLSKPTENFLTPFKYGRPEEGITPEEMRLTYAKQARQLEMVQNNGRLDLRQFSPMSVLHCEVVPDENKNSWLNIADVNKHIYRLNPEVVIVGLWSQGIYSSHNLKEEGTNPHKDLVSIPYHSGSETSVFELVMSIHSAAQLVTLLEHDLQMAFLKNEI